MQPQVEAVIVVIVRVASLFRLDAARLQRLLTRLEALALAYHLVREAKLPAFDQIRHQHGHGHGSDAAGDGRDLVHSLQALFVELDVPAEHAIFARLASTIAALVVTAADLNEADAYVDNDRASLEPVRLDESRHAARCDDNVSVAYSLLEQLFRSLTEANRDERVELVEEKVHRHTNDVTPADERDVLTLDAICGAEHVLQDGDNSERCTRDEVRSVALQGQAANIERMEPIDVLLRPNHVDDSLFVQVRRQGKLHEHATNLRVFLELANLLHELLFTRVRRQLVTTVADANFVTRLEF